VITDPVAGTPLVVPIGGHGGRPELSRQLRVTM
jgi:hypothetical protein